MFTAKLPVPLIERVRLLLVILLLTTSLLSVSVFLGLAPGLLDISMYLYKSPILLLESDFILLLILGVLALFLYFLVILFTIKGKINLDITIEHNRLLFEGYPSLYGLNDEFMRVVSKVSILPFNTIKEVRISGSSIFLNKNHAGTEELIFPSEQKAQDFYKELKAALKKRR